MHTITAKQLHLETKSVLDHLEQGKAMIVTRNGKAIARLEPVSAAKAEEWDGIMEEVWRAQTEIPRNARTPNPVLADRNRRRR